MDTATEMTVGNVVGKTDYDFWPEAEAERLQRVDRAVISEGVERKRFRETQIMLDGTEATLETTKIPLRDMITGEVVSLLGIYEDVTDRLEEEAMEIRREHDRKIARSIGHCLKGWIAILEGTCLALTMEHNETPNIKRLNDGIAFLKHATKMATVHYALDAKKDPEEFSLNELLSSIVETIVDERISFHADGRSPIIQGQRFHLQNAFLEIIANARDFAPVPAHNGRIEISIEVCDKSVSIHVRDNGRGVPPHLKSSIFELFVTSSDVRTGMGLAYVKRIIVEIHNGNVEEIGTLGHGAHFVITLPLVEKTT